MKDYHLEKKFYEFRDLRELLKTSAEKYADRVAFVTKIKNKKEVNYINTTYAGLFPRWDIWERLCSIGASAARG